MFRLVEELPELFEIRHYMKHAPHLHVYVALAKAIGVRQKSRTERIPYLKHALARGSLPKYTSSLVKDAKRPKLDAPSKKKQPCVGFFPTNAPSTKKRKASQQLDNSARTPRQPNEEQPTMTTTSTTAEINEPSTDNITPGGQRYVLFSCLCRTPVFVLTLLLLNVVRASKRVLL